MCVIYQSLTSDCHTSYQTLEFKVLVTCNLDSGEYSYISPPTMALKMQHWKAYYSLFMVFRPYSYVTIPGSHQLQAEKSSYILISHMAHHIPVLRVLVSMKSQALAYITPEVHLTLKFYSFHNEILLPIKVNQEDFTYMDITITFVYSKNERNI